MAESAQRLALMVGLSCLVIGIAGVLAALYLMDRTVIARIKVTQDAAERLGQGLTLPDADTSPDEIGRLDAALHKAADILATRSREINDATRKALEARSEAEAANSAKNEFMSRISHELRTPLNAVLGFGQLLQADTKSPADQESVNQILDGGRRLLQLVNEVLDITQAESGNLLLARQPTDIAEALSPPSTSRSPSRRNTGSPFGTARSCRSIISSWPTRSGCIRCCSICCRTLPSTTDRAAPSR